MHGNISHTDSKFFAGSPSSGGCTGQPEAIVNGGGVLGTTSSPGQSVNPACSGPSSTGTCVFAEAEVSSLAGPFATAGGTTSATSGCNLFGAAGCEGNSLFGTGGGLFAGVSNKGTSLFDQTPCSTGGSLFGTGGGLFAGASNKGTSVLDQTLCSTGGSLFGTGGGLFAGVSNKGTSVFDQTPCSTGDSLFGTGGGLFAGVSNKGTSLFDQTPCSTGGSLFGTGGGLFAGVSNKGTSVFDQTLCSTGGSLFGTGGGLFAGVLNKGTMFDQTPCSTGGSLFGQGSQFTETVCASSFSSSSLFGDSSMFGTGGGLFSAAAATTGFSFGETSSCVTDASFDIHVNLRAGGPRVKVSVLPSWKFSDLSLAIQSHLEPGTVVTQILVGMFKSPLPENVTLASSLTSACDVFAVLQIKIKLRVLLASGKILATVEALDSWKLHDLLHELEAHLDAKQACQSIMFGQSLLVETQTLAEMGINNGADLQAIITSTSNLHMFKPARAEVFFQRHHINWFLNGRCCGNLDVLHSSMEWASPSAKSLALELSAAFGRSRDSQVGDFRPRSVGGGGCDIVVISDPCNDMKTACLDALAVIDDEARSQSVLEEPQGPDETATIFLNTANCMFPRAYNGGDASGVADGVEMMVERLSHCFQLKLLPFQRDLMHYPVIIGGCIEDGSIVGLFSCPFMIAVRRGRA